MYTTFFICSGEEDSSSEAEDSLIVDEQPAKAPVPPVVPVQVKLLLNYYLALILKQCIVRSL